MTKTDGHEAARALIEVLANGNPDGDPHGMIEPTYCQECEAFLARKPETVANPLTLREWKRLRADHDKAFKRKLNATDPLVFLFVLRDRMVYTSGCTDFVISAVSVAIDPYIDPQTVEWR